MMPEVKARVASAVSAAAPLSSKFFNDRAVEQSAKLDAVRALLMSRLLYNARTWTNLVTLSLFS